MKSLFLNIIVFGILVSLAACARELATNEEQLIEEEITSSYSPKANMQDIKAFIEERGKGIPVKGPATYEIAPILNDADTVMYLVNYSDGWELLSGDKRTSPVIMWCASGNMSMEKLFSVPALSTVINSFSDYLKEDLKDAPVQPLTTKSSSNNPNPPHTFTDNNGRYWVYAYRTLTSSYDKTQKPLMGTKWGQGEKNHVLFPYEKWNVACPYDSPARTQHCYTGCGQVACAQTLFYLHKKFSSNNKIYKSSSTTAYLPNKTSAVSITNSNTTFSQYGNYWSSLPADGESATNAQFMTASTLMLDVGKKIHASYKYDKTSAPFENYEDAFSSYGYNSKTGAINEDLVYNQIYVKKLPIIAWIIGETSTQTDEGVKEVEFNHAIVIEGYQNIEEHYTYAYKNGDSGTFDYQYRPYVFTYTYIAVNWGFDGAGEYDSTSNDIIWMNYATTLTRYFSKDSNRGTIREVLYDFSEK